MKKSIKFIFNRIKTEETKFFDSYPSKCLSKYFGIICILLAIIFAIFKLIPSASLLMLIGFLLLLFAHPAGFKDIAIGLTGFKATRLLEEAEVKLEHLKKISLLLIPKHVDNIQQCYHRSYPIFNSTHEKDFKQSISLLRDFKENNEADALEASWFNITKMRYIELILVASKTRSNSEEIKELESRHDNPPSIEEMKAFFEKKQLSEKIRENVNLWLDYYGYYIKYKQHKNLDFIQELNAYDYQLRNAAFFGPDASPLEK